MKKVRFSKLILIGLLLFLIIFIAFNMYIFLKTGTEQTALIAAVFGFCTTEVWKLATIKNNKIKHGKDTNNGDENNIEYGDSFSSNN